LKELLKLWDIFNWYPWYSGSDMRECECEFKEALWNLKHKIDLLIKENKELRELVQPRKLTKKDKKRILKKFFEEEMLFDQWI